MALTLKVLMTCAFVLAACSPIRPDADDTPTVNTISDEQLLLQTLGGPYTRSPEAYDELDQLLYELLIAINSDAMQKPEVLLVNHPALLAWSSKNNIGSISICRGLLAAIPNREALAAVLAHELIHLTTLGETKPGKSAHQQLEIEMAADKSAADLLETIEASGGMQSLLKMLTNRATTDSQRQSYKQRLENLHRDSANQQKTLPQMPKWQKKMADEESHYKKYREAQAELKQGDVYSVITAAHSLIESIPDEAKFQILTGDVLDQPGTPCYHYTAATQLSPGWFLPWLKLADCQLAQSQLHAAALSAEKAQLLLPTNRGEELLRASHNTKVALKPIRRAF